MTTSTRPVLDRRRHQMHEVYLVCLARVHALALEKNSKKKRVDT